MFTGIIEEVGAVTNIERTAKGVRLGLSATVCAQDVKVGDSLAVNGCCLTIVATSDRENNHTLEFDILDETWQRTNLKHCVAGSLINLERPLAASGRFHGHMVSGHIDGTGTIKTFEPAGPDWKLIIEPPVAGLRYLIEKGSIAVDGISLTVAALERDSFTLWIIPHTRKVTALQSRKMGDVVNLEFDMVGKYIERLLQLDKHSSRVS